MLKIPAQIENIDNNDEDDSEENINVRPPPPMAQLKINTKAARRALKRAKKEARRKVLVGGSPMYLSGTSPRYAIGGSSSPRYTIGNASPRQGFGNNSPRYMVSSYELNLPRRRKHKMKHKKKHKEEKDRKHKEGEVSIFVSRSIRIEHHGFIGFISFHPASAINLNKYMVSTYEAVVRQR